MGVDVAWHLGYSVVLIRESGFYHVRLDQYGGRIGSWGMMEAGELCEGGGEMDI